MGNISTALTSTDDKRSSKTAPERDDNADSDNGGGGVDDSEDDDNDFVAKPKSKSLPKPKVVKKTTKARQGQNNASPTKSSLARAVGASAPVVFAAATASEVAVAGSSFQRTTKEQPSLPSTSKVPDKPTSKKMPALRITAENFDLRSGTQPTHVGKLNNNSGYELPI